MIAARLFLFSSLAAVVFALCRWWFTPARVRNCRSLFWIESVGWVVLPWYDTDLGHRVIVLCKI